MSLYFIQLSIIQKLKLSLLSLILLLIILTFYTLLQSPEDLTSNLQLSLSKRLTTETTNLSKIQAANNSMFVEEMKQNDRKNEAYVSQRYTFNRCEWIVTERLQVELAAIRNK